MNYVNWSLENPTWCNATNKQYLLKIDEACFHLTNDFSASSEKPLELWGQSDKCGKVFEFLQ